ncbi:hypothetical protein KFE25_011390 [Diacronema lutheri]|uniref:Uncharacterized protein n=1 Tax=Diacronema lutheri TaxID=2081491 RepID=A0A8J5XKS3_DIALT|nr:hypothetical protein KFE25_011390 [Diacronema lutheri]
MGTCAGGRALRSASRLAPCAAARKGDGFGGERARLLAQLDTCASGEAVAEVLELLRTSGMGADADGYRAGISRCAALPDGADWALLLLDDMRALGVPPDGACVGAALAAAVGGGQLGAIEQVLERTEKSGVELALADMCAAISAVRALSDGAASFGATRAGARWAHDVRRALHADGGRVVDVRGCSAELALEAVRAVLDELVERQLAAGAGASEVAGELRVRFGPAPSLAAAAATAGGTAASRGADDDGDAGDGDAGDGDAGVDPVALAVQRALSEPRGGVAGLQCKLVRTRAGGATRALHRRADGRADGAREGRDESDAAGARTARAALAAAAAAAAAAEACDLVCSQSALERWVRGRCVARWCADTDRLIGGAAERGGARAPDWSSAPASERRSAISARADGLAGRATRAASAQRTVDAVGPGVCVSAVKGVGHKRREQLVAVGVATVGQLAALLDEDVGVVAAQSGCPAGMLDKYVAEARRLLGTPSKLS